ncbi:MAG: flagellar capping protein FliD [Salibacteraceae bacterium]
MEICGDESKELDPGIDSVSYIWNTGQTTRKITVKESKVFSITVTDTASGCASFDEVRVEYDAICVSIDEDLKETTLISYFPNPTNGLLNMKVEGLQAQNVKLFIFNMTGAEVFSSEIEIHDLIQETSIDLSGLEKGNYLIRMVTNSGSVVHRITKY